VGGFNYRKSNHSQKNVILNLFQDDGVCERIGKQENKKEKTALIMSAA